MTKLQYQRLLQLREDQKKLLRLLIELGYKPRDIIQTTGISHKRVWYLLQKIDKYEWGTCMDNGWICEEDKIFIK